MDLRRLRAGELLAATGGVVLLVSLFLPWYRPSATAWQALAANDLILALVAAVAVSQLVVSAAHGAPGVPIATNSLVALFGLIGLVLVLVRVVWLPDLADQRAWGLWLGLAGAGAIVAGAWLAMRDQSPAVSAPQAEIEITTLPAPRGSE
jgi:hypothetical protein